MRRALILVIAVVAVSSSAFGQHKTPPKPAVPMAKPTAPAPVAPFDPQVARRITPTDVKLRMDAGETPTILDTRTRFTGAMIKGAHQVPMDKVVDWAKDVPKDTWIVTYCTCPAEHTAANVVLKLQELGYTNAFALLGGLSAWQYNELPTETPAAHP